MDSIGAEVGQKMRSAIKAKLMELECYVGKLDLDPLSTKGDISSICVTYYMMMLTDDELPDYIMVMVANKRTKAQMNEDLYLFLSAKTSTFVNWLHVVLKKLKEITVTNPEVYKKATKRKYSDVPPDDKSLLNVKKERTHKKFPKVIQEAQFDKPVDVGLEHNEGSSITDNIPVSANTLSVGRRILVENNKEDSANGNIANDSFDIPLLSEVNNVSNEQELRDIERKIRNVKSRLGLLVESDDEKDDTDDGDVVHLSVKSENEESNSKHSVVKGQEEILSTLQTRNEYFRSTTPTNLETNSEKDKPKHKRIVFEQNNEQILVKSRLIRAPNRERSPLRDNSKKKLSILDRLGKRMDSPGRSEERERKRSRSPLRRSQKPEAKDSILSRVGVQSKIAVIKKPVPIPQNDEEEKMIVREVQSAIKVKPRVIPGNVIQPNKNLLLKAVAEAQRSIAQTPKVGKEVWVKGFDTKPINTNRATAAVKPKLGAQGDLRKKVNQFSGRLKGRLQLSSDEADSDFEYVPKPVDNVEEDVPQYVPSSRRYCEIKNPIEELEVARKQQFIITLDGAEKLHFDHNSTLESIKSNEIMEQRSHSPIVFEAANNKEKSRKAMRADIPDELPVIHPPLAVKTKERCKYWPNCRQSDKCEFVHPSGNCQTFPKCKFGNKCLFLHPKCRFGSSCSKRDCPYDHSKSITSVSGLQNCKFYPNCANTKCPFFHPKPCKYGKFCKNMSNCDFSHGGSNKKNLTWRSK